MPGSIEIGILSNGGAFIALARISPVSLWICLCARDLTSTIVVGAEHAGGGMRLRHDEALGAVAVEGGAFGLEWQFAQVHPLLAHSLGRVVRAAGLLVEHHGAHFHA